MIKTTVEQRKRAYYRVAQLMDSGLGSDFLCDQLRLHFDPKRVYGYEKVLDYCPEFALFEPRVKKHYLEWWDLSDKQSRVICMLLCYEMCK